ncbi:hypothetical protein Tco_0899625 [Tanacetum coccineum]
MTPCLYHLIMSLVGPAVPGNIVKALGGRGIRKEKSSTKEVIFSKADESSSELIPEITSDSESECEGQEPLSPILKLIRAKPACTLNSLLSLADLTLNMTDLTLDTSVTKKTKPTSDKVSPAYVIKKKTESKSPVVLDKKADSSTKQLLLTLMEEVKGLKMKIKTPSNTSPSNSQASSSKSTIERTWFGPCKHCGLRNHLSDKCSTCGSSNHLTKEYIGHTTFNKTISKINAQSSANPLVKKDHLIPKPFKDCKYRGFNRHHSNNYEYYPGCEVCGSIAHELVDCPKKLLNNRKPRIDKMADENVPAPAPIRSDDQIHLFAAWVPIGKRNYVLDLQKRQKNPIF